MSNYESMYWIVVNDGMNRTRCGVWVVAGAVASVILMLLNVCAAIYMIFPIVYYVVALYKRSHHTGHIFGFDIYPGYATMKLTIFVSSVILYWCTSHGYIPIEFSYPTIAVMIASYGAGLLWTGWIATFIRIQDFDTVFKEKFGALTAEDIEARKKIFGEDVDTKEQN